MDVIKKGVLMTGLMEKIMPKIYQQKERKINKRIILTEEHELNCSY